MPPIINKDSVILKNSLGEVDDEVQYQETLLTGCFVQLKEGSSAGRKGINPNDDSKLFIFDVGTLAIDPVSKAPKSYISHEKWEKLSLEDKAKHWTLSEGDFFAKEDSAVELKIIEFSHKDSGSKRMHHFEVHGL